MNRNNLKCRCGDTESWRLAWGQLTKRSWTMTTEWSLNLECDSCGAVHVLAQADDYNARAVDVLDSCSQKKYKGDAS